MTPWLLLVLLGLGLAVFLIVRSRLFWLIVLAVIVLACIIAARSG